MEQTNEMSASAPITEDAATSNRQQHQNAGAIRIENSSTTSDPPFHSDILPNATDAHTKSVSFTNSNQQHQQQALSYPNDRIIQRNPDNSFRDDVKNSVSLNTNATQHESVSEEAETSFKSNDDDNSVDSDNHHEVSSEGESSSSSSSKSSTKSSGDDDDVFSGSGGSSLHSLHGRHSPAPVVQVTELLPPPSPVLALPSRSPRGHRRRVLSSNSLGGKNKRSLWQRQLSASKLEMGDTLGPLASDHISTLMMMPSFDQAHDYAQHTSNMTSSSNNNSNNTTKRTSSVRDLSTGRMGGARSLQASIRTGNHKNPRPSRSTMIREGITNFTIRMPPPSPPTASKSLLLEDSSNHKQQHQLHSDNLLNDISIRSNDSEQQQPVSEVCPSSPTSIKSGGSIYDSPRSPPIAVRYVASPKDNANNDANDDEERAGGGGDNHYNNNNNNTDAATTETAVVKSDQVQYRLRASKSQRKRSMCRRIMGCCGSIYEEHTGQLDPNRFSVNQLVMLYLHWTFRSSFGMVFLSACLGFLCLTMLFATAIMFLGKKNPECIAGIGGENGDEQNWFMDSFVLSWTTFSTVGYGLVYSGISSEVTNIKRCTVLTIVVTLEAFVGVLFAGMFGAIIYTKVSRVQSFAQVIFSDPMVIRYGSGVQVDDDNVDAKVDGICSDDESHESGGDGGPTAKIPCPVLEFRILNRMSAVAGGEILDAMVNIVASIDASQACPTIRSATRPNRRRRGRKRVRAPVRRTNGKGGNNTPTHTRSMSFDSLSGVPSSLKLPSMRSNRNIYHPSVSSSSSSKKFANVPLSKSMSTIRSLGKTHQAFEEDPTGHLVPRRIFSKLNVESQEHPFFKRSWMVRHVLDEYSPLLKAHARQLLQANNGFWPRELNSPEGIQAAVHFDQILVSMSGTSNADANPVYAQHVYYFCDVNVGYRFVNVLYRDVRDQSLMVDNRLINDVTEQAGGGAEPLTKVESPDTIVDLMLVL